MIGTVYTAANGLNRESNYISNPSIMRVIFMYLVLVFLHILAVFAFLMAHGVSVAVAFALKRERKPERIQTLLNLSGGSIGVVHISLLIILVLGVVMGFMGKWWGHGWIWASLGLLIAMYVYMGLAGSGFYGKVRKAVGTEYMEGTKMHKPDVPAPQEEIDALLNKANPGLLAVVGYSAIILLTWLMKFKPF
jgi:hypothetical protein